MKKATFCKFCSTVFDGVYKLHPKLNVIEDFLKDDFGDLAIEPISKDMINARKSRSIGKSPWKI
ncbi:hypothetical protein HC928_02755 [bacterium]|nr:hypothetical protein [bacterium]